MHRPHLWHPLDLGQAGTLVLFFFLKLGLVASPCDAHPHGFCLFVPTRPQLLAVLHNVDDGVDVERDGDNVHNAGQYWAALFEIRGTDLERVGSVALPTPAGPLPPYRGIDVAVVARPAVRAAFPQLDAGVARYSNLDVTDEE